MNKLIPCGPCTQTNSFFDKKACLATKITLFVVGVLATAAFAVCLTQGVGSFSYLALAGGGVAGLAGAVLCVRDRIQSKTPPEPPRLQIDNPLPDVIVNEFFEAISDEKVERVQEMLDSYPTLATCRDPEDGETSTAAASRIGRKTITKELLDKGARADIADGSGKYPIHWAAFSGNMVIISMLHLKAPSLINAGDTNGNTPLHIAAGKDEKGDVVSRLRVSGGNLDLRNNKGYTPLFCAVVQGRNYTVQAFLKLGADLSMADEEKGETPLHFVCRQNGPAMLKVMLPYVQKNALTIKDKSGKSPLDYAELYKARPEESVYSILSSSY